MITAKSESSDRKRASRVTARERSERPREREIRATAGERSVLNNSKIDRSEERSAPSEESERVTARERAKRLREIESSDCERSNRATARERSTPSEEIERVTARDRAKRLHENDLHRNGRVTTERSAPSEESERVTARDRAKRLHENDLRRVTTRDRVERLRENDLRRVTTEQSSDDKTILHPHAPRLVQIVLAQSLGSIPGGHSLSLLTRRRSFCRHSTVLSSLDRSVVTRPFCHHLIVLSSLDRSVVTRRRSFSRGRSTRSLAVTQCRSFSHNRLARSLAVPWLDLSRSLARSPHSAQIVLSQSLDSISRSRSARSLAVAWLDLSQSLARSPHSAQIILSQLLGSIYLAVIRHRLFSRSRLDLSLAVTRLALLRSLNSLFVLSRSYSAWIALSQSLRSISRGHSTRSLAVTRLALCGYSSWIALSQLLGADRGHSTLYLRLLVIHISLGDTRLGSLSRSHSDRSIAVTRLALLRSLDSLFALLGADRSFAVPQIDLSRSLDSLSCSHSTRSLRLLVMDSSLVDTRLGSLSRSHSDRSLAVTRLALLRSLDSLFALSRAFVVLCYWFVYYFLDQTDSKTKHSLSTRLYDFFYDGPSVIRACRYTCTAKLQDNTLMECSYRAVSVREAVYTADISHTSIYTSVVMNQVRQTAYSPIELKKIIVFLPAETVEAAKKRWRRANVASAAKIKRRRPRRRRAPISKNRRECERFGGQSPKDQAHVTNGKLKEITLDLKPINLNPESATLFTSVAWTGHVLDPSPARNTRHKAATS
ncbi:hypothetical protein HID58_042349 [Brassica napus]|uniref:Uncharacterized protein n=1 Tax=Brassica napus TaxID=3708 RepID=A0ABQ8BDH0_BRANA|nr:hypothetical protein HID58_042349 [Brassica napus]